MRIGIFGGSFDPVHYGHLILADVARETAGLDRVLFVPAARSPLKPDPPVARDRQRLEMLGLALAGNPAFETSDIELQRDGISYTVDTLESLRQDHPESELFLLIGADSLEQFYLWKDPRRICELAIPLVAARHGSTADLGLLAPLVDQPRMEQIEKFAFEFPRVEISSTRLRERLATGKSIRYRLPRSVESYIENAKLYATDIRSAAGA